MTFTFTIPKKQTTYCNEFILLIQAFGRMKLEHQNFETPAMTVFISRSLPAKECDFSYQEENRAEEDSQVEHWKSAARHTG